MLHDCMLAASPKHSLVIQLSRLLHLGDSLLDIAEREVGSVVKITLVIQTKESVWCLANVAAI